MVTATTSPAKAFGDRAVIEERIEGLVESALRDYLRLALVEAEQAGLNTTLAWFNALWEKVVDEQVAVSPFDVDEIEWLRPEITTSTVPEDTHGVVLAIFLLGGHYAWSTSRTRAALREALDFDRGGLPEEPELAKVAGARRTLGNDARRWASRAKSIARTTATGLVNRTTQGALSLLRFEGKRWVTRHDDRVRGSHRLADGQVVPVDAMFSVGRTTLRFPADPQGPAEEIVNCRCVMVGVRRLP